MDFTQPNFGDIVLESASKTHFWASKHLLVHVSGVFRNFLGDELIGDDKIWPLDFPDEVIQQVLEYLYYHKFPSDFEDVAKLAVFADFTEITILINRCKEFISTYNCEILSLCRVNNLFKAVEVLYHAGAVNFIKYLCLNIRTPEILYNTIQCRGEDIQPWTVMQYCTDLLLLVCIYRVVLSNSEHAAEYVTCLFERIDKPDKLCRTIKNYYGLSLNAKYYVAALPYARTKLSHDNLYDWVCDEIKCSQCKDSKIISRLSDLLSHKNLNRYYDAFDLTEFHHILPFIHELLDATKNKKVLLEFLEYLTGYCGHIYQIEGIQRTYDMDEIIKQLVGKYIGPGAVLDPLSRNWYRRYRNPLSTLLIYHDNDEYVVKVYEKLWKLTPVST